MILCPLSLAILLLDAVTALVYGAAAWRLVRLLPGWQPQSADRRQLRRERDLETCTLQGGWTLWLQSASCLLLVIGISNAWPLRVPGAMCGTGVLQAMGPSGSSDLFLRILAVALLFCWRILERLDAADPQNPLALQQGRLLLLAAPVLVLAWSEHLRALTAVAGREPVSCCAVVYELGRGGALSALLDSLPPRAWMISSLSAALPPALWGWLNWRGTASPSVGRALPATVFVSLWIGLSAAALKFGFSTYIYEVLRHPCPWCLFLGDHGFIGFALFGFLALAAAGGLAGLIAAAASRHSPQLIPHALRLARRAGLCLMVGTLGFAILAAAPALMWRVRFGGWMF